MKKIDAHLHLAKIVAGYCRRGELRAIGAGKAAWANGEEFDLFPQNGDYGEMNFTAEQALALMKKYEVERAVLMQGSMYGFQNRYYAELIETYPERFCPACTVDPYMTNAAETMEYFFEKKGFRAAKFEVSSGGGLMGCHDAFDLADSKMRALFDIIEAHHAVVALDVGDLTMDSHQPWALARIAQDYPNMKLVVCHLLAPMKGKEKELELSLELLKKPNVWFDISALPKIVEQGGDYPFVKVHEVLQFAKAIVGTDRLLWGSDAPFAATQYPYHQLADYLQEGDTFTQTELQAVYYENARRVYFNSEQ